MEVDKSLSNIKKIFENVTTVCMMLTNQILHLLMVLNFIRMKQFRS